jgi:hypothetical protein
MRTVRRSTTCSCSKSARERRLNGSRGWSRPPTGPLAARTFIALEKKRRGWMMKRVALAFFFGVVVGHFAISGANAQIRTVKTTNLLTADLAGWCDGKELTVELNEAGAGTSGKHYHPAHSLTWILEGTETYTMQDSQPES